MFVRRNREGIKDEPAFVPAENGRSIPFCGTPPHFLGRCVVVLTGQEMLTASIWRRWEVQREQRESSHRLRRSNISRPTQISSEILKIVVKVAAKSVVAFLSRPRHFISRPHTQNIDVIAAAVHTAAQIHSSRLSSMRRPLHQLSGNS